MQAFVIDAFAFCRLNEQREGSTPVADLPRLVSEAASSEGALQWSVKGGVNQLGYPQLILSVAGQLQLMCQRCLTPFVYDLDSESTLVFAKSEDEADEIEALLDDEEVDVVVGSKSLNILDLIEDEALLEVPQSPKHAVCPGGKAASDVEANSDRESPFAVLKKINGHT